VVYINDGSVIQRPKSEARRAENGSVRSSGSAEEPLQKLIFGRPSAKRNGSPYAIGPLSCLSVCLSLTLVYCGQTLGRIKTTRDLEAGLGLGHIMLDVDPAPPPQKKGAQQPPARWIKMPLSTEVGIGRGHIVLDGDTVPLPRKGAQHPSFRPMSTVAKRSPISATPEHL